MNNQDFKKYAIGFVVAIAVMAAIRILVGVQGGAMMGSADFIDGPEGYDPSQEQVMLMAPAQGLPPIMMLGWYIFGIQRPLTETICAMEFDEMGNRYYECGPAN